jgi:hypothetical protein
VNASTFVPVQTSPSEAEIRAHVEALQAAWLRKRGKGGWLTLTREQAVAQFERESAWLDAHHVATCFQPDCGFSLATHFE